MTRGSRCIWGKVKAGLYAILQYHPKPTRREGINVGVVLFDCEEGIVVGRCTLDLDRLFAHFGSEVEMDAERIRTAMQRALDALLHMRPVTHEMIRRRVGTDISNVAMTEALPIVLAKPHEEVVTDLFDELVR